MHGWAKALSLALCGALAGAGGARAETFSIQAKSFIAHINWEDPSQFGPDPKKCQVVLAKAINCLVNEDPPDGSEASAKFRLRSEIAGNATCEGNTIKSWTIDAPTPGFGKEGPLPGSGDFAKAVHASPAMSGTKTTAMVTFGYRLRGQPHSAPSEVMYLVKPRTCTYIWHEVTGTLACQGGKLSVTAQISGSHFPSHRLWVQGKKTQEIAQGPFLNLWKCDAADPTLVQ